MIAPKPKEGSRAFTVYLPNSLYNRMAEAAFVNRDKNYATLVRRAVQTEVEKLERKAQKRETTQ